MKIPTSLPETASEWPDNRPYCSLYIHVPFCRHRCGYCNFTLVAGRDYLIDRFVDGVVQEIDGWLATRSGQRVEPLKTVYLGGGTPSHLAGRGLGRLVESIRSRFPLAGDCEFTIECNPEDIDEMSVEEMSSLGVNRVSLGVQSLKAEKLKLLERNHTEEEVARGIELCRSFARSISLDAIFSIPGETLQDWRNDLGRILDLRPDHVSTYELTWEKGTSFWGRLEKGEWLGADEDLRSEMYEAAIEMLEVRGLTQYEISSFASGERHRSRHNSVYWNGRGWLAFGPGAASFERGVRFMRHRSVTEWMNQARAGVFRYERDELSLPARSMELLCVALRQIQGVDRDSFLAATGLLIDDFFPDIRDSLIKSGLAEFTASGWKLTKRGIFLHDQVSGRLMERVEFPN